ncbi:unnamed protein product [Ilex paraguariensis]|uniref:Uncharacterized protein n=1 Tax=Ilex paraguariensis TaxID=185542 RepID=A0ABC8TX92_9AQUA
MGDILFGSHTFDAYILSSSYGINLENALPIEGVTKVDTNVLPVEADSDDPDYVLNESIDDTDSDDPSWQYEDLEGDNDDIFNVIVPTTTANCQLGGGR